MQAADYIQEYITRARKAQQTYETFSQEQVDRIVRAAAKAVYDNAETLARLAVEETGMGVYEDKVAKNKMKSKIIWNSLKGKKSVGILSHDEKTGITEIAKPIGVVAAITPTTNPNVTPMSNAMFALKGRNAIIITPHHRAVQSSTLTVELINREIRKAGGPDHLVQILDRQSRENTKLLIESVDLIIATGGMGMVKAAYSSGKPALGVGAGNVQCIIDRDADLTAAVPKIIKGRTFDNGIICSGEQSVIVPEEKLEDVLSEFKRNGGFLVASQDRDKLRETLFQEGEMSKHVVGQSVHKLAELSGIRMPDETSVILVEAEHDGDVLGKEKMCPVLTVYTYNTFEEAVDIARRNLEMEGKGHSACLHSNNKRHIEYTGEALSVSRLIVNQTSATSAGGSFFNGLTPTNTLGCGSWGNNSISENLGYKHLINISRISYHMKDNIVPTDQELWEEL